MKLNLACNRFKRLWNERDGRALSAKDELFLASHVQRCEECAEFRDSAESALQVLRLAAMEPVVSAGFDERVIRKVRIQTARQSIGYWSPALIGGAIACIALVAMLQIAESPVQLNRASLPEGQASLDGTSDHPLPSLILSNKPRLR